VPEATTHEAPDARQPVFQSYIQREADVADAVRHVRRAAEKLGFSAVNCCYIATAASELATNLVIHAAGGTFTIDADHHAHRLEIVTQDVGPGIPDIAQALRDGFSTSGGLGCGLPGVKRLMDGLEVESEVGKGTRIRAWKQLAG